ncbi:cell division protein FtsZ [Thermodesulfobacteriota bacterium]
MKFEFIDEKERHNARIKVMGVGGAGGNAINNMISSNLKGVDFIAANTDCQDLERSASSYRLQLGPSTTKGLGAGADPEIGARSAEESISEIREAVDSSDMVFVTAGMGGGTGTGASPIIAQQCRENGALTIGVVTKPFKFEGEKRMKTAVNGIKILREEVDSLIVIPNERLKTLGDSQSTFKELIERADDVLFQAVKGISDLIMSNGFINLDFADVKKVMTQMGTAIMGIGMASGENRAIDAAQMAINSPLLEDISISGAEGLLMNITGPSNMSMNELDEACNYIKEEVSTGAEIFWGVVFDEAMSDEIRITVIATGIGQDSRRHGKTQRKSLPDNAEENKVVNLRDVTSEEAQETWTVRKIDDTISSNDVLDGTSLDTPTFLRERHIAVEHRGKGGKKRKGLLSKFSLKDNLEIPTFQRWGLD